MDVGDVHPWVLLGGQVQEGRPLRLGHGATAQLLKAGLELGEVFQGGARAGELVVIKGDGAVFVANGHHTAFETAFGDGHRGPALAFQRESITILAGGAVDAGDEIGGDTLRYLGMQIQQMGVVGVEPVGPIGGEVAHRLHPGPDDQILMAGQNPHGRKRHRLLARTAETVEGDAGNGDRPPGVQHGHAPDVVSVVPHVGTVAGDHVVNVGGLETDPLLQALQHLSQDPLGVQVGQGALALFADAPGGTHPVDNPRFVLASGHVHAPVPRVATSSPQRGSGKQFLGREQVVPRGGVDEGAGVGGALGIRYHHVVGVSAVDAHAGGVHHRHDHQRVPPQRQRARSG